MSSTFAHMPKYKGNTFAIPIFPTTIINLHTYTINITLKLNSENLSNEPFLKYIYLMLYYN